MAHHLAAGGGVGELVAAVVKEEVVEVLAVLAEGLLTLEADGDGVGTVALGIAADGGVLAGLAVELIENFEVLTKWAGLV